MDYLRAREVKPGSAEKAFNKAIKIVEEEDSFWKLHKAKKRAFAEMDKVKYDKNRDVLYVDVTGEIFLVCDPFSNQNIERELGKMGVQVRKSLTVSSFLKDATSCFGLQRGKSVRTDWQNRILCVT